ncbi:MAG: hypothetical protein ABI426_03740 [Flavobacterium sp.]
MLKNILNLEGAQKLTVAEQKVINGGIGIGCKYVLPDVDDPFYCGPGYTFKSYVAGRGNYCCKTV